MKKEDNKLKNKNSVIEWHALEEEEVLKQLNSTKEGLNVEEVQERLKIYGKNEIKERHKIRPIIILLSQFNSFFIYLLLIAAIISLLAAHLLDFYAILAIVVLNAFIGFIQNYKAEKAIQNLKKSLVPKARVLRKNILYEISATEIVPGDILILEEGDKIMADARIIESHELQCNEAILTGESAPVDKFAKKIKPETVIAERQNMIYSGTTVVRGSCKAIVVATGMNTEFGKIASLIQKTKQEKAPLQKTIDSFAIKLGIIIMALCFIIAILGIYFGLDRIEAMLTAISLAVSAVPEGLPAVITICLALAVQRMFKANSLIRKLPAAETLGRVTVICSDKTGTMTEEKIEVVKLFYNNKIQELHQARDDVKKNETASMLLKINCLCNNARAEKLDGKTIYFGDPTEQALLRAAIFCGLNKEELTKNELRVKEFTFTSARKMMSIVRKSNSELYSYVKGAPETIIERCKYEFVEGKYLLLNEKRKQELLKVYEELAEQGLRVLGFAFKKIEKVNQKEAETNLVFVGLQGMLDPPRPEVKDAIKICKEAGIEVKMITGDSLLTAKAVAKKIGLVGEAMNGKEIEMLSDEELKAKLKETVIFARTSPEQKLRIVTLLKEQGEIVAVTGDGINDAPALKKADIGIAMGIRGTDVTRDVADIVLMDDNFASIVKAIEEGRIVYDNTKKFTKFLLSVNFSEIFLILYSILLKLPLPLLPLQILWMNLITDSIPALALSIEKGENVMKRKPLKEKNILEGMLTFILMAGILAFGIELIAFYIGLSKFEIDKTRTIVLTVSILFQMFFVFTCRSNKPLQKIGFFSNKYLIIAVIASIALHLIIIYSPLNLIFKLIPLKSEELLMTFLLAILGLVVFEIYKNIKYKND
ncbi:MAG: calcium-translocating P-type ATPase, PMCA-type [Candidatus Pacearchaeota archaeon]